MDGKNFIEEPFVTLTVNNEGISDEHSFTPCGPSDIKKVIVRHIEEGTGKELAPQDVFKGYNISMIQGFDIAPKNIKGYTVIESPKINLDEDYVDNGRVYTYVYRATLEPENVFTDVREQDYFYDAVLWAVANGVTTGKTETTFSPRTSCTRAQVVTFLWRAAGQPEPEQLTNRFSDVSKDKYYYKAVLWAYENGITTGKTATTFLPDQTVTRAEVITFLWRAEGKEKVDRNNPFTDIEKNSYYYDAVLWAVENGITTGTTVTTFSPKQNCVRCEVVSFLYRKLNK